MKRNIQLQRNIIITEFKSLGFLGMTSFYNVCKSLDATLNGFELIAFYFGHKVDQKIINRLYEIIESLKYE
jgi:hypothetical protein